MSLFPALFVIVPVVEVLLFVVVGDRIGLGSTMLVVLGTGVLGAFVATHQGTAVWRELRTELVAGRFPGRQLAHGAMVLVGGALLLTPGFLTDIVGFGLMVPPLREVVRRWGARRFAVRSGIIDL